MIPYLPHPEIAFGPLRLSLFGLLVGIGVFLGFLTCLRVAHRAGLSVAEIGRVAPWALVPGFIGSATFRIFLYAPRELRERGWIALVDFGRGMSSYGGFIFATLGVALYAWLYRRSFLQLTDVLVQGLAVGWVFGRLGCTFAHDHIGIATEFVLGVNYPDETRHNLGLYEFLLTLGVLLPVLVLLHRRVRYRAGLFVVAVSLFYGPVRFVLDYLRVREAERMVGGFTAAQYLSLGLVLIGVGVASWGRGMEER